MYKKSIIASIILTILNIFPTLFCAYLNSQIVLEGAESLGLLVIVPYTFMLLPTSLVLLIPGLILSIRAIKSDSNKIKTTAIIFTCINIILAAVCVYILIKFVPLFFK